MKFDKGKRIVGAERAAVSESFVARYAAGESIRSLAAESGRSYGFVQGILKDAGVTFRSRGGARISQKAEPNSGEPAAPN
ncbi:MAG: helix-turn-helix domain-containing protein [Acidobacteriota bacterium]|nr:helix-turn-helix domain-containing protein [Acidobacteriota bacterium]NLH71303.1 transcriptional regulator [Brooklawnia sp.]